MPAYAIGRREMRDPSCRTEDPPLIERRQSRSALDAVLVDEV